MNRKESLACIAAVFSAIDGPQDGFSTVRDILYRLNLESEKQHRRGRYGVAGLTVPQAAKLSTIWHIAQGLEKPDRWTIDDINSVRLEALKAQAYAKRHRAEFLAAFESAGYSVADVLALDYAELMK
jgi:hypothetical protein